MVIESSSNYSKMSMRTLLRGLVETELSISKKQEIIIKCEGAIHPHSLDIQLNKPEVHLGAPFVASLILCISHSLISLCHLKVKLLSLNALTERPCNYLVKTRSKRAKNKKKSKCLIWTCSVNYPKMIGIKR